MQNAECKIEVSALRTILIMPQGHTIILHFTFWILHLICHLDHCESNDLFADLEALLEDLGDAFDPNLHNAVMHIDSEELGENVIAQVFQKGFKIGDKVVRFAMVQVAN